MALTSREVAEAYIDVHGDMTPFRKQLEKAGQEARKSGMAAAEKYSDGWNRRMKESIGPKWEAMIDAMYQNDKVSWDKLIEKFDSTDLDAASEKVNHFLEEMRLAGKLTNKQMQEVRKEVEQQIKSRQNQLFVERDLLDAEHEMTNALREQQRVRTAVIDLVDRTNTQMIQQVDTQTRVLDVVRRSTAGLRDQGREAEGAAKKFNLLDFVAAKVAKSWARMDSTVRMVLSLIAVSAGSMATLGSGLAGSGTALVSSLGMAAAAGVPLLSLMTGVGVAVGLAVSSMENMKKQFPAIEANATRVGDAWQAQADRFGTMWGPALAGLLGSLATRLASVDFGTPFGKAMASITHSFSEVINGPAFTALLNAMVTILPNAVSSFGEGFAHVMNTVVNLMAGAAPVAALLAQDFLHWATGINEAMDAARQSGAMNAVFEKARASLLAVLDLTGSLGIMLGTVFGIGSESGNRMLASLTQIVDRFTAWMNTDAGRAAMVEWFNNAEAIMRSMAPLLVGLGQAMAILVTPETIAMFADLNNTMGQLLPIIAQVLAVISQLGILNLIASLFLVVGQAIQPLLPPLMQLAAQLGPILQGAILALAPLFNALVAAIIPIVQAVLQVVGVIGPFLVPAITSIVAAVTPVIAVLGQLIAFIVGALAPILGPILAGMISGVVLLFHGLSNMIMGAVNIIKSIITGMAAVFRAIFAGDIPGVMRALSTMFSGIWNGIKQILLGALQAIVGFVQVYVVGRLVSLVKGGLTAAANFFKSIWSGISGSVSSFLARISGSVSSNMAAIGSRVSSGLSAVRNFFSSAWSAAVNFVSSGFSNMVSRVGSGIGQIMSFVGSLPGRIAGALGGLGGRLAQIGTMAMAGFISGVSAMAGNMVQAAVDAVGGAINAVKNLLNLGSPSKLFRQFGVWTGEGYEDGMMRMQSRIGRAATVMADASLAPFAGNKWKATGQYAAESLVAGMKSANIQQAITQMTPSMSIGVNSAGFRVPSAGTTSATSAAAAPTAVFNDGAIRFETKVTDPKIAAGQLMDTITRNVSKMG